eukprot:TRINITY_DN7713_c0_g1_i1.p1 TRINITY_DN7713_c0_g1~~TRINITY_DN7713_c0_g1_i1.p1  ORF type:complete len:391 (+),score=95.18 TRINITY_DN7713_c0_g1_i1:97-1269(+)
MSFSLRKPAPKYIKGAIMSPKVDQCYIFKREIGQGAFSRVYRAEHIKTGTSVAIKHVIKSSLNEKAYQRLQDEVLLLTSCNHPNIMKFFECYDSPTHISIVTEYCEGGDLFDRIIEKSHFTEEEAAPIFRQIIEGVRYLHDRGITHRDLKPENILFRTKAPNSPIAIADFGFAKRQGSSRLMHSDVGTPDYAAPEILAFSYTESVDMWACGCMLYCMLYCIPPYYDDSPAETLRKVTSGQPVEFYDHYQVSPLGKNLIKGFLERNPKGRFTAEAALRHPWFQKFSPKTDNFPQKQEAIIDLLANRDELKANEPHHTTADEEKRQQIISSICRINDILSHQRKDEDESMGADGETHAAHAPSGAIPDLRMGLKKSMNIIIDYERKEKADTL